MYKFLIKQVFILWTICSTIQVLAQSKDNSLLLKFPLTKSIDLTAISDLPEAKIISMAPAPFTDNKNKKLLLDEQRIQKQNTRVFNKTSSNHAVSPIVGKNFMGNLVMSTPNDNDIAISNGGKILSAVNQNIRIYNDTGRELYGRTLAAIATALGPLNRTFDPRVIYDPEADRFILVFLQGSTSLDTRIIVGFSQTNDPQLKWNFYTIPGNITSDNSWSDYPIIAINKNELFVTVNRLKDSTSWQNGFLESYIWQINKFNGYNADSLQTKNYNNINYNGKSIWSLCPVKNNYQLQTPGMFFVSHRPGDLSNDTVFLHYIDNTIESGAAKLTTRVLKSNCPYGLPPNAYQPNGKKLQTNDARVLSAMIVNGEILYVGNSIDTALYNPSIYLGRIENTWEASPKATAQLISFDSLDIGYPSIAYAGAGSYGDPSSMIAFSHSSKKHFPGTSVVYLDRNFNVSAPVFVKQGESVISLLADSVQRWGDYSGVQTKYNELGVCWLASSYGTLSRDNRAWIGKVQNQDPLLRIPKNEIISKTNLYPNPVSSVFTLEFEMPSSQLLEIRLISMDGKSIVLNKELAKAGLNELRIETSTIQNGNYLLQLTNENKSILTKRIVIDRH